MNTMTLNNNEMFKLAPSIFAQVPHSTVSDTYGFINTISAVDALRDEGFVVTRASQTNTRNESKVPYTKHLIRMRHVDTLGQDLKEVPEIVLINSHDRSSAFTVSTGIFRIACSNGLVVKSSDFGEFKTFHSAKGIHNVVEGVARLVTDMPLVAQQIELFKSVQHDLQSMLDFAKGALAIRYAIPEAAPIKAEQLLGVRRDEDAKQDLWSVFNVVQENLLQGGVKSRSRKTRPIGSINEDTRINKALWAMTTDYAVAMQ